MRGIWKTWLQVWFCGTVLFGAVLALFAVPPLDGPARQILTVIGGGAIDLAALDQPVVRFAFGLQGALTLGWAVTMWGLVRVADRIGPPAWRWLTAGLITWYGIDSTISIATGFPLNAASNTVLLVTFLVPVLASGVLQSKASMQA